MAQLHGPDSAGNLALVATHHGTSVPALRRGQSPGAVFHTAKDIEIQNSGALSPGRRSPYRSASSLLPADTAAVAAAATRSMVVPALDDSRAARDELVRALGEQLLLIDRLFRTTDEKVQARGLLVHTTKAAKALLSTTAALEAVARRAQATHEAEALEAGRVRKDLEAKLDAERCARAAEATNADVAAREAAQEASATLASVRAAAAESERDLLARLASKQEALEQLEALRKFQVDDAERKRREEVAALDTSLNEKRRNELAALQAKKDKSERALQVRERALQVKAQGLQVCPRAHCTRLPCVEGLTCCTTLLAAPRGLYRACRNTSHLTCTLSLAFGRRRI